MNRRLEIFLLGEFRMYVDGSNIMHMFGASRKKIALLQYLLVHPGQATSVKDLFETLWPDEDNSNPENALKTLMSRLRKNLDDFGLQNAIITKSGAYMWNPELDCAIDIYELEKLNQDLIAQKGLTDEGTEKFERLLLLYGDDLLGGTNTEPWAVSRSVYYHNLYLRTVYHYVQLLNERKRFGDVVRVCRVALEIDSLDSKLNLELMSALLKLGRSREAMAQYELTTDIHYNHLGVKPPEEILMFYKNLIQNEGTTEQEITEIMEELLDSPEISGALVCEYSIFKDIYNLYMRNLRRLGISMFLVLMAVNSQENQSVDALLMDKVMSQLLDVLKSSLRKGDTISRYSSTQFVLLLPSVNYDSGRMVMERVKKVFYDKCPITKFVFNYRLAPIDTPLR